MALNVVLMATGEFATPSLQAIHASGHPLKALITQPDRLNPRGKPHPHPLKECALSLDIPVHQPDSINTPESIELLKTLNPDVVIVAAYGQILKSAVINVPRLGMFNLHASLLPRHRGAAPIQYAIWMGDQSTGVTVFQIEPKLDAGPMLVQKATDILPDETSGELHDRLAMIGADAVLETLQHLDQGTAQPILQDKSLVTLSPKIKKEAGEIDWSLGCQQVDCHIRAMQPWPNAFTHLHREGKEPERCLILKVKTNHSLSVFGQPGQIEVAANNALLVSTGDGVVSVELIQPAGKKPMSAAEFLRGRSLESGAHFISKQPTE